MNKIRLQHLRNGEYIQYLNDVLTVIKANNKIYTPLKTYIDPLQNQVIKLEQVFKFRGHALIVKIREADQKRARCINAFGYYTLDNRFKHL